MASTSLLPEAPYPPFNTFRQEAEADLTDTYPDDLSNHTASTRDNRHPRGDSPLSFRNRGNVTSSSRDLTRGDGAIGSGNGREARNLSLSGLLDFLDGEDDASLSEEGEMEEDEYGSDVRVNGVSGSTVSHESRERNASASPTQGRYRLSSTPPPDHTNHLHHPDTTPQPHLTHSNILRSPHEKSNQRPIQTDSERRGVKNGSTASTEHDYTLDQSSPSFHLSARNGNGNGREQRDWSGKGKERAREEEEERDGEREDGRYERKGMDRVHDDVQVEFESIVSQSPLSPSRRHISNTPRQDSNGAYSRPRSRLREQNQDVPINDSQDRASLLNELKSAKEYIAHLQSEMRTIKLQVRELQTNPIRRRNGEKLDARLSQGSIEPIRPPLPNAATSSPQDIIEVAKHILNLLPPSSAPSPSLHSINLALAFTRSMDGLLFSSTNSQGGRRDENIFQEENLEVLVRRVRSWEREIRPV